VAELLALDEALRELVHDADTVAFEGFTHLIPCSGARILTTLVSELRRRGGGYGLAALCIGVGQGIAMVVEADGAR
jgi:hypothetical protein